MAKISAELKVGIIVFLAALALAAMVMFYGKFSFAEKGYEMYALFDYSGGVQVGAPVRLAGVEVGKVKEMRMVYEPKTKVELVLFLDEGVMVREGAEAYIATLGLMGEKYVEISPGRKGGHILGQGARMPAREPVRLEKLMQTGQEMISQLAETMQIINRMVGSEELQETLCQSIKNAEIVTANLTKITEEMQGIIGENRDDINKAIENFAAASESLRKLLEEVEEHPTILLRGRKRVRKKRER